MFPLPWRCDDQRSPPLLCRHVTVVKAHVPQVISTRSTLNVESRHLIVLRSLYSALHPSTRMSFKLPSVTGSSSSRAQGARDSSLCSSLPSKLRNSSKTTYCSGAPTC